MNLQLLLICSSVFLTFFACSCVCGNTTTVKSTISDTRKATKRPHSPSPNRTSTLIRTRNNGTAFNKIKAQIHDIVDKDIGKIVRNKLSNMGNKFKNITKTLNSTFHKSAIFAVPKNISSIATITSSTNKNITTVRIKRDNLDDLYPSLAIRSVNVNLNWFNFAKTTNVSQLGTMLRLYNGKNLIAHVMNVGNHGNFYTIPSLEQDRVYKGEIKILTDKNEVTNFIRKQSMSAKNIDEFELTTPFIVLDQNVNDILETRDILEKRMAKKTQNLKVNNIDIKIIFPKLEKLGYTIEISRYQSNGNRSSLLPPEQTIELIPPVKYIILSDQQPHQLLRVLLRKVHENENTGDIYFTTVSAINIFTGSVYEKNVSNFTTTTLAAENRKTGNTTSNSLKKLRTVKCYLEDEVFNGYPCLNSDICVPLDWVCDGEFDCPGHDDEHDCNDSGIGNDYYSRSECRKFEFRCRSKGQAVCLPNSWLCDGRSDCSNSWDEDEENCYQLYKQLRPGFSTRKTVYESKPCGRYHFRCWDGKDCVALRDVCDGNDDCIDGSDENICENWSRYCDSSSEFKCYKSAVLLNSLFSRSCIPRSWVCDDQEDCPDGEDESYRMCNNYNKFSFNILKPLGIGFEISAGFK